MYSLNKSFIPLYTGRKADSIVKSFSQDLDLESISNNVYCNNFIDHFHVFHVLCLHYFLTFPAAILVYMYHGSVNFYKHFNEYIKFGETHKPKTWRSALFIFHNITISLSFPLDGFRFIFYCMTVKTIYC